MSTPRQAGQASPWLSLAFFVTGFAALPAAYLWLSINADAVTTHYLLLESVTLAHLAVLGWVTMVMMGATYQLISVLTQAPLFSPRLAAVQYALYLIGVGGLLESFGRSDVTGLPIHAAAALLGVLVFLLNIGLTLRRIQCWSVPALYLATALAVFALTVHIGFLYALNMHQHWFPLTGHRLAIHAHLGIAGWMGITLIGVSYRLLPMFLLVRAHEERRAKRNLVALCVALAALTAALLFDLPRPLLFAAGATLGGAYLAAGWDIVRMFRARLRRRIDLYTWHLFLSLGCMAVAVAMGVLTLTGWPQRWNGEVAWMEAYAFMALGGWLTFALMGNCYKIVPMLTWQLRHGAHGSTAGAPLLTEMYHHRLATVALALYASGFLAVFADLLTGNANLLSWSALVAAGGVAGFVANMAWVMLGHHAPSMPNRRPSGITQSKAA